MFEGQLSHLELVLFTYFPGLQTQEPFLSVKVAMQLHLVAPEFEVENSGQGKQFYIPYDGL